MRANGTHVRRLTHGANHETAEAFSPNGRWIAYNDNADIALMRPGGSHKHRLTHTPNVFESQLDFSPHGKWITFARSSTRVLRDDVFNMRSNGTHLRRLTRSTAHDEDPAFSPNGKRIVFESDRHRAAGSTMLYSMSARGGDIRRVTRHGFAAAPSWGVHR
jgi:TolB protein